MDGTPASLPPGIGGPATPAPPAGSAPRSALRNVFVGTGGIRAGWRLLMFLAILLVFLAVLTAPVVLLSRAGSIGKASDPYMVIVGDTAPFLAAVLAALVMGAVEGRTLADYGLPPRGAFAMPFWHGALWGFAALSAVLLATAAAGGFSFGTVALDGRNAAYYGILWAAAFLAVGCLEEFLMRGYALLTLTTGIGFWPSAFLLSAVFGISHLPNGGENWAGALNAGLIGLFFCLTLRRTGDLWFAIGLHAAWDYAQSFVYSVPDSGMMVRGHLLNSAVHGPAWLTGGSVGPEGSVFGFAVIGALFVLFDRTHRSIRFPAPRYRAAPASMAAGPRPLGLSTGND